MQEDSPAQETKQLPADVVQYMFNFLDWRGLQTVAVVCRKWHELSDAKKNFWKKKLEEEKGLNFDPKNFPPGFLEAHPIDYRALYFRIRHIPPNKLFNNSAFMHYGYYVVVCALVGGDTFWDALELHGKPRSFAFSKDATSYYIAGTFAISGDLESLKRFDEGSLQEDGILLEGAVKGGSLPIIEWLLDKVEEGRESYLQSCYAWAIEYRQPRVTELLETKYQQMEPVIVENPWYCLDKAIVSDSVPMVCRFLNPERIPPHFLKLAASNNAASVFWYGVNTLNLDFNKPDSQGWMPVHYVAEQGHLELFRQIANHPNCCLHLRDPECRVASDQLAYLQLLKKAVVEDSCQIVRVLHREFNVDLSVVDPETGNTLGHECCLRTSLKVFRYLVLHSNIDWSHSNKQGKTVAQCGTLENLDNPFFLSQNCRYYYLQHFQVIELLIKAISTDEDAKAFTARLVQHHNDHPQDIMACLALAIVFKDDRSVCAQYKSAARSVNRRQYNESVKIMQYIAYHLQNIATIDTSCFKTRLARACAVM